MLFYSDLSNAIFKKIRSHKYECLICCKPLHSNKGEQIWTCQLCCFAVFHWKCIDRWRQRETSTDSLRMIRCPACRFEYTNDVDFKGSFCFCSKATSTDECKNFCCGQQCLKKQALCKHSCLLKCHPGSCPKCTNIAYQVCYCGKSKLKSSCAQSSLSFSCEQRCMKLLDCSRHFCMQMCHEGACSSCNWLSLPLSCLCGKNSKQFTCKETFTSLLEYSCNEICDKLLDCGKHRCREICHLECRKECSKRHQIFCYCGKNGLSDDVIDKLLQDCDYVIESCGLPCGKIMNCGHFCSLKCHTGNCIPEECKELIEICCRCGNEKKQIPCSLASKELFLCSKICTKLKACGKHKCTDKCCSANLNENLFEHKCSTKCGRLLSCNMHYCQETCHQGYCSYCPLTRFEVISCHCGNTELIPPVYCNMTLPECPYPCVRREGRCIEHFYDVPHSCHEYEQCPKCPALVKVDCYCGSSQLVTECWKRSIKNVCGKACPKILPCGHQCGMPCHSNLCGPCNVPCQKSLNEFIKDCGHACGQKCHFGIDCSEFKECTVEVVKKCACSRRQEVSPCYKSEELLECSDECFRQERIESLAKALSINSLAGESCSLENNSSLAESTNTSAMNGKECYSAFLCSFAKNNLLFCLRIENSFFAFSKRTGRSIFYFPPMNHTKRQFICEYAEIWNLDHESIDKEPVRSVVLWKRTTSPPIIVPLVLLSEYLNIKDQAPIAESCISSDNIQVVNEDFSVDTFLDDMPSNGMIVTFTEDNETSSVLSYLNDTLPNITYQSKIDNDKLKIQFNRNVSEKLLHKIRRYIVRNVFGSIVEICNLSF